MGARAARVLIAAGWDYERARVLSFIRFDTADDARVFLGRPLRQRERDDRLSGGIRTGAPFDVRDALRLAEAGPLRGGELPSRRGNHGRRPNARGREPARW